MRNPRRCRYLPIVALAGLLWSPAQAAEEHEVRMLNRGEAGIMVFEPAYLEIAPGDTVHFRSADRGHNAAAIDGMVPPGGESWAGQLNQDVSVTFEAEGVHGVRCVPHYAMGMVALIVVGDPAVNLDAASAVSHSGKARERMAELLARVE
jgi:pseudoazurin